MSSGRIDPVTPERLREMIGEGESLRLEFKSEKDERFNDSDMIKAVVCLANRPGEEMAWLLVGVEDDGIVTGARPRHESGITDSRRVQALLANRTRPSLSCRVQIVSFEGKEVLCVEVPPARTPVGTSDGIYLRRAIGHRGVPECLPYHYHEMQANQSDRGHLDYSALVVPEARWDDLDPLEFERFRRTIRENRGAADASLLNLPDLEMAKVLGAIVANHEVKAVRTIALLLFGKEEALRNYIPTHEAAFQRLSGTTVVQNEFFRHPLIRLMEEMLGRFRATNKENEVHVGMLRIGVPDYSEAAVREALANALIHRDYTKTGAAHLQWHDERMEIANPGGFPEGVRLNNILVTPPRPRNPLLADAFKRAGIVERTARGIDRIYFEQLRNGRPAPNYDRTTQNSVVLVLPGGEANMDFVKLIVEEGQGGHPLDLDGLLIVNEMWRERRMDVKHVAHLIQKPDSDARATLTRLVEAGLVDSAGSRASRSYHLSASTYRRMGEKEAYIRQRGFEPIQQEQMILQFVRQNGRIQRNEAAQLCKVSSLQARHLLGKLVKTGTLAMKGARRGAFYELASKDMNKSK